MIAIRLEKRKQRVAQGAQDEERDNLVEDCLATVGMRSMVSIELPRVTRRLELPPEEQEGFLGAMSSFY